jgi:MoxR-like ATPase
MGKDDVIERVLICLAAGGHILIEDLPGLGKTTMAYSLARAMGCSFSRVQFTSDLLPGDIIGVSIYDEREKEFVFKRGPLFANLLLADEINRSTPKTQSALLEAMDRSRVSVDGRTYELEPPFMVFATQNPVDSEGTFPLPDSQMDRFLMRLQMGYPEPEHEMRILEAGLRAYDDIETEPVVSREEVLEIQGWTRKVFVEESVLRYMLDIVTATREEDTLKAGLSTRGALSIKLAAQAAALMKGRAYVLPVDVETVLAPVCAHRLIPRRRGADLLEERAAVEEILTAIASSIPMPR